MEETKKMSDQHISAFAAYAAKPKKNKPDRISCFKIKGKKKLKKQKQLQQNNVNSVLNTILKVNMSDSSNAKYISKHTEKIELLKSLQRSKGGIFTDCSLVTKVDNSFFDKGDGQVRYLDKESDLKQINGCEVLEGKQLKEVKRRNCGNFQILSEVNSEKNCQLVKENNVRGFEYKITESLRPRKKKNNKKIEGTSECPKLIYSDSVKIGEEVFSWMLSPIDIKDFFENCWEQKPLHIRHNEVNFFSSICTLKDFEFALEQNEMYFTKNIDVTSYIDGERTTDNPEGKARASIVWDMYNSGKSIRLLNPQSFIPNVQLLNSTLQEFFQCFVGANIYLTPPGTQGFAPHYDDIEAFVLQLEGEKQWKLYNPRAPEEVLPRESSRNFQEDEIGDPILEITLQPGDLLYFPRGIIHQAKCLPHIHSLHITVSCYQKNSWADLLEKVLPVALQKAISENSEFRKGLPIGYLNHMGMVYCDHKTKLRREMKNKFDELVQKVVQYCPLDAGVDQMAANFMHDALPPFLSNEEKVYGANLYDRVEAKNFLERLKNLSNKNLGLKLIRANSVRLVSEEDGTFLYYTTDNSLVYREHEACCINIPLSWAQAIDHLIHSYPNFVRMKDLPVVVSIKKPNKWKRVAEFVYFLWQKGLLLFDRPFKQINN